MVKKKVVKQSDKDITSGPHPLSDEDMEDVVDKMEVEKGKKYSPAERREVIVKLRGLEGGTVSVLQQMVQDVSTAAAVNAFEQFITMVDKSTGSDGEWSIPPDGMITALRGVQRKIAAEGIIEGAPPPRVKKGSKKEVKSAEKKGGGFERLFSWGAK